MKQQMDGERRFAEAAEVRREAHRRSGVRARAAATLRAAAERLEPAPRDRPGAA